MGRARAETAARDAIKAAGKQFAEPRDAFKGDEVAITYKMGMESPKPLVENTQIEGDGPSIKFEAKVKIKSTVAPRKFDDSGAEVWNFTCNFLWRLIKDGSITQDDWQYILDADTGLWKKPKDSAGNLLYQTKAFASMF